MKRHFLAYPVIILMGFFISPITTTGQSAPGQKNIAVGNTVKYKDGTYEGKSRAKYTSEPYWGIARITVKSGVISEVNFMIRDSSLHETFSEKYEKHFEGNPEYIQQSRNDWGGVKAYNKKLSETHDLSKTDAISGATWSYNIFKASVEEALKKAQ